MASTGKKILVGCGIGCGVLLLAGIIAVVSFFVWLGRAKTPQDTRAAADAECVSFLEFDLRPDDPGTLDLIQAFLEELRKNPPRLPEQNDLSKLLESLQRPAAMRKQDLETLLPIRVGIALHERPGEAERVIVGAVSFGPRYNLWAGILRLMLLSAQPVATSGKARIHQLPSPPDSTHAPLKVALLENTLLFSQEPGTDEISAAAGRLQGQVAPSLPAGIEDLRGGAAGDVWGFLLNRGDALAGFLGAIAPGSLEGADPAALAGVRAAVFILDLQPADRASVAIRIDTDGPEAAAAFLPVAREALRAAAGPRGLQGEIRDRIEGSRIALEADIEGIGKGLAGGFVRAIPPPSPAPAPTPEAPPAYPAPSGAEAAPAAP